MTVGEICTIIQKCELLRSALINPDITLTQEDLENLCDLIWDYREILLKKEVK